MIHAEGRNRTYQVCRFHGERINRYANEAVINSSCPALHHTTLHHTTQHHATPHHTNCSPEPQDPCTTNYLRYFEGSQSFTSILCLLVKIDMYKLKIRLQQDWGWNFNVFSIGS